VEKINTMGKSEKRPSKDYDVKFYVMWNQDRRLFDIRRDGVATGGFARDKITAIGLAIADARRASAQGNSACVVAYSQHGNRVVEWESHGLGASSAPQVNRSADSS
jgi:hypothetical protein